MVFDEIVLYVVLGLPYLPYLHKTTSFPSLSFLFPDLTPVTDLFFHDNLPQGSPLFCDVLLSLTGPLVPSYVFSSLPRPCLKGEVEHRTGIGNVPEKVSLHLGRAKKMSTVSTRKGLVLDVNVWGVVVPGFLSLEFQYEHLY